MKYMLLIALALIPMGLASGQVELHTGENYHRFDVNATEPQQQVIATPIPSFGVSNATTLTPSFQSSNATQILFGISNSTTITAVAQEAHIPNWVKGIFAYWEQGNISDSELVNALQFLIKAGIIILQ